MINKKTFLILLGPILVTIVSVSYYYIRSNANRPIGWETTKSAQEPFKPGIITDGRPPGDFEISLIEPKSSPIIIVKPSEPCQFSVKVKTSDTDISGSNIPPTFVFLNIISTDRRSSKAILSPSAKNERSYLFSGRVSAPEKIGDYEVTVEVEYAIYDTSSGKTVRLKPFRKTIKGAILHVSN